MFHVASQNASAVQLDNPPENVVLAMQDAGTYDYISEWSDDMSDIEMTSDISSVYDNIEDFEADFDYQLKPEYASLEIPTSSQT